MELSTWSVVRAKAGLVQTISPWSGLLFFGRARGKMVSSAQPRGNVCKMSVAASHLVRALDSPR